MDQVFQSWRLKSLRQRFKSPRDWVSKRKTGSLSIDLWPGDHRDCERLFGSRERLMETIRDSYRDWGDARDWGEILLFRPGLGIGPGISFCMELIIFLKKWKFDVCQQKICIKFIYCFQLYVFGNRKAFLAFLQFWTKMCNLI